MILIRLQKKQTKQLAISFLKNYDFPTDIVQVKKQHCSGSCFLPKENRIVLSLEQIQKILGRLQSQDFYSIALAIFAHELGHYLDKKLSEKVFLREQLFDSFNNHFGNVSWCERLNEWEKWRNHTLAIEEYAWEKARFYYDREISIFDKVHTYAIDTYEQKCIRFRNQLLDRERRAVW